MSTIEKHKIFGSFEEQVDKNLLGKIEDIYKKIDDESEFEVMFFNYKQDQNKMNLEYFLKILEYLTYKSKKNNFKLEDVQTLDINYSKQSGETYRITLSGIETINKYIKMLHNRKNHVIFSVLVGLIGKDDNITLMKKVKERENIVDIDDFDIRIRLSSETGVSKKEFAELQKLDETSRDNMIFRYKQRVSLKLEDKKDISLAIDLTNIKMTKYINRIESIVPSYELEIDLSTKSKTASIDKKHLDMMYQEITTLLKIIQQSNFIISKSLQNEVLSNYANLLNVNKDQMTSLEGRKPQSLEIQHVVDQLPNKFAVSDKADGDRYFLIIHKNAVFLISDLLNVKTTGIILTESVKSKYNDSILDGELIFIKAYNRYLFMAFDCLINNNKDIRQESSFMERLRNAEEIINGCFILKNQTGTKLNTYKGDFDLNKILKFHGDNIETYMKSINHDLAIEKQYPLIRRKYFIDALGGQNNEIFKYSLLMWNKYTKDNNVQCPYLLDGLIYHPLDQKYITSVKDSKFVEYKWKPQEKNSIDFYVQYERNRETNKIVTLYDNSKDEEEQIRGKPYKILKLYVGKVVRGVEQPVLFEPETDSVKCLAYMFLNNGESRDVMDNIVQDETVVEFYYNNDPNIPDKHRWVPLRTRYDKTESVQRYGKKYGNYSDIAYKVWRSIRNPFVMNDIELLSKDNIYSKHNEILRGKIDHSIILSERKENIYYQIRTTLGKPMRNFQNWITSILIYTYINSMYEQANQKLSVLDIACRRGEDIMKYYYGKVDFMVATDVDNDSLMSPVDGALSRYNQLRKNKPNFPRMFFIHADGGVLLNLEDQMKTLGGMSDKNKQLIEQFFSKDPKEKTRFDRINCQMAMHKFFENETIFDNFTQNLQDYLKPNGFFIATAFDGDRIIKLLADKNAYTQYFTNQNGEQKVLFEIIKKYENTTNGIGIAIDFHNALQFQEGSYQTEYLIQKSFIEKELLNRCDLELIETDLYENQYIIHKDFFENIYKEESKEETKTFFTNASEFYTQKTEVNKASYQLMRLYRYYVFRKKDSKGITDSSVKVQTKTTTSKPDKKEMSKKKSTQKAGNTIVGSNDYIFNDAVDILNPIKFIKRDILDNPEHSFLSSVHDILKTQNVIPESISMKDFYKDISFDLHKDKEITDKKMIDLNKNLVIKHDYSESEKSSEMALTGINMLIIKKDCDGGSVIDTIGPNGKIDKKIPSSLIYYDGQKYYPIYKIKDGDKIGMFDTRMRFIKELIDNKN